MTTDRTLQKCAPPDEFTKGCRESIWYDARNDIEWHWCDGHGIKQWKQALTNASHFSLTYAKFRQHAFPELVKDPGIEYNVNTIEGRENIIRRIFTDCGLEPPKDLINAVVWIERVYTEARETQFLYDSHAIREHQAEQTLALLQDLPGPRYQMEKRQPVGWY